MKFIDYLIANHSKNVNVDIVDGTVTVWTHEGGDVGDYKIQDHGEDWVRYQRQGNPDTVIVAHVGNIITRRDGGH